MRDGESVAGHRLLAFWFDFLIAPDRTVAGMQAGHEGAAARRADGGAGVSLREAHPLGGEAVNIRRADQFLSKAPDIAVPQIVGEDEDDIWRLGSGEGSCGK